MTDRGLWAPWLFFHRGLAAKPPSCFSIVTATLPPSCAHQITVEPSMIGVIELSL